MTMKQVLGVLEAVAARRESDGCSRRSIIQELAEAAAAKCSEIPSNCTQMSAAEATRVLFDAGIHK